MLETLLKSLGFIFKQRVHIPYKTSKKRVGDVRINPELVLFDEGSSIMLSPSPTLWPSCSSSWERKVVFVSCRSRLLTTIFSKLKCFLEYELKALKNHMNSIQFWKFQRFSRSLQNREIHWHIGDFGDFERSGRSRHLRRQNLHIKGVSVGLLLHFTVPNCSNLD